MNGCQRQEICSQEKIGRVICVWEKVVFPDVKVPCAKTLFAWLFVFHYMISFIALEETGYHHVKVNWIDRVYLHMYFTNFLDYIIPTSLKVLLFIASEKMAKSWFTPWSKHLPLVVKILNSVYIANLHAKLCYWPKFEGSSIHSVWENGEVVTYPIE